MNGRACSLVRASEVRECTVPVRGLEMAVCFLCGVVRLRTAYRGGICGQADAGLDCRSCRARLHSQARTGTEKYSFSLFS